MGDSFQVQIDKVRASISTLEAQRSILGDEIVNTALSALRNQLAQLEEQATAQSAPVEERRLVTILFIDVVGSTSMAEKLDPEEWRQIISSLHNTLAEVITSHHGTIAQYLGDGLLALFGSQQASEHDPENAIRAALEAHVAVAHLEFPQKVQIRAGIHTGLVVVGELGDASHKEFTASGDAMNLAARLQSAAVPGGTLISHDTYRYVRGVFDLTPNPPLSVKGKSEPIQTYLVRRLKPRPFRSVTRGVAGVEARTVGREEEIQALQAAYLRAFENHVVVWAQLLGEPGVGKSRLLVDVMDWLDLRDENFRLLRARAFPDDANQPFAFIRRMWFDRFQIAEDAPLENAEAKWVERFKEFYCQDECEEAAHALGLLVGLRFEDSPHIKGMRNDPTQVKGRALVVSRDLVRAIRQQDPIVMLLEDLQWVDASSWEYLMEVFLDETTQPNGLFILGSARPELRLPPDLEKLFTPSSSEGKNGANLGIKLSLLPLSDLATRQLAQELLQRATDVPEAVLDLLVERSEGVPYFTEEIINWFIDNKILDTQGELWHFFPEKLKIEPLPASLQHLLLARVSSLSRPEQTALQRGAIIGRRFWTGGVEALGVDGVAEMLAHLQPRGFVEAQPESAFEGETEWSFHHNLLHEVTYESVLKRERLALHKVAAGWLEGQARRAGRLDEFAGLLGYHYERAGELSVAADWYLQAGRSAIGQGAPRESSAFYNLALELLPPVERERRWQALLGREEADAVLGDVHLWRADINALLDLAQAFDDDRYLAEAHLRRAIFGMRAGDIPIVKEAVQEALAAAQRCGIEEIEIKALALMAQIGSIQADKTGTLQNIEKAIHRARILGDESVLSFVLFRAAFCYEELGDTAIGVPYQIEQIELDHRRGDRINESMGLVNLASTYIGLGQYKEARVVTDQARVINEAVASRRALAYNYLHLSIIHNASGDYRKGRQYAEQSLREFSPTQDERGKIFALYAIGRALVAMGDAPGAFRRFYEARQSALSQGIASQIYEATASLAVCAVMQGQLDEARKYVHEAWDYIKEHGWWGIGNSILTYRNCAETFDALGDVENFNAVIEAAHQVIMDNAERINVPAWRQSYLQNVPSNRVLMQMWERNKR